MRSWFWKSSAAVQLLSDGTVDSSLPFNEAAGFWTAWVDP